LLVFRHYRYAAKNYVFFALMLYNKKNWLRESGFQAFLQVQNRQIP